ncbi:hypothetical protein [Neisseria gonorrhoeae]|uniref:hypothetical protein n=1 Tax=Neisseria gonorrhoeae TaxID=485 RepID=UPI0022400E3A|nr:hypothetical protein [Neisseria gonorrhoeae]UYP52446.1 hypothetical protein ND436_002655 [Neisseria gonorrhoeae]
MYAFNSSDKGKPFIRALPIRKRCPGEENRAANMATGNTPSDLDEVHEAQFKGKKALLELESVTSGKLGLFSTKNDDFSVPEIDFTASTDEAGFKIGTLWIQE